MNPLEKRIHEVYSRVQFAKNIWRKAGEPDNAQFRLDRALLTLLKAQLINERSDSLG